MAREFGQTQDTIDFVQVKQGADPAEVQAILTKGVEAAFPVAEVLNQQELKESREEQVDQLVNLVYALLLLAIVISLFGIANTLALSIHERTRELGMLRAIGMSRRQVRTMIRYEAVITALIGAILGMVLGLVFAALIAQPLKDEGFTLSYPIGSLIGLLVFAASSGCSPRSRRPAAPRGSTCSSRSSTSKLRSALLQRAACTAAISSSVRSCCSPPSAPATQWAAWSESSSRATLSSAAWIAVTWVTTSMQ